MKLLLDTHIWLWSLLDQSKLARRVARALENKSNELWLSSISIWELTILVRKGRITLDVNVDEWVDRAFKIAPRIRLAHGDPADAFLAATAHVFGLTLVTADQRLLAADSVPTLANR